MLKFIAWLTMSVFSPATAPAASNTHEPIQIQQQDTVSRKRPTLPGKEGSTGERSTLRQLTPFSAEEDRQQIGVMLDSLLRHNPGLKSPFLKDLLIPPALQMRPARISELDSLNQQLLRASKFSVLERMGLIARHYANVNPNAKSYSTHQIDIIGTIFWLGEILK